MSALLSLSGVASAFGTTTVVPIRVGPAIAYGPSGGSGYTSFTANTVAHKNHYNTYLMPDGGSPIRINEPGTSGGVSGIDGDRAVFSQSVGDDFDLKIYDITTKTVTDPPAELNTALAEQDPSLSGDWILFDRYDYEADPVEATIVLYNLLTGEERVLARGKNFSVFSEQVNGNFAVYTKGIHEFIYDIAADTATQLPQPNAKLYGAGSVTSDGTAYVVRAKFQCGRGGQIRRIDPDGTVTVIYKFAQGSQIYWKTFAIENEDGSTSVYFDSLSCTTEDSDIYRLDGADTATGPVTAMRING